MLTLEETVNRVCISIDKVETINYSREPKKWFEEVIALTDFSLELVNLLLAKENMNDYIDISLKLKSIMEQIIEAMQNKDFVLVNDLISYEMKDIMELF